MNPRKWLLLLAAQFEANFSAFTEWNSIECMCYYTLKKKKKIKPPIIFYNFSTVPSVITSFIIKYARNLKTAKLVECPVSFTISINKKVIRLFYKLQKKNSTNPWANFFLSLPSYVSCFNQQVKLYRNYAQKKKN